MASSSSSSSVFLSFNARDTGNNFSDHLYAALNKEIQVFKHGYAGQTISEDVVKAIKESRFAVVVFSKNYANSSLCLEELSTIMTCLNQTAGGPKKVLPVFYRVDPSDICVQEQWWIQKYITGVCKCIPWCERAYATEQEGEEDALTAATKLPDPVLIPPNNTGEYAFINMIVQRTLADVEKSDRSIGKLFFSDKKIGNDGSSGTIVLEGTYENRPVAVKRVVKEHHVVVKKEIQNLIESDMHSNIVRYYDVEYDQDFVYIALERCICSLHELILSQTNPTVQLQQRTLKVGSFKLREPNGHPSTELLKVMRDTVAGLAHLHKLGFIHRDLKPQNVLICKYSSISAKVSDMGISKCLPADKFSLTYSTGNGNTGWLAPETLSKKRQTRAVDLFSLGCLLFFCVTGGRHPFGDDIYDRDTNIMEDRKYLSSLEDNIPEAFDLVSNLIHRDPESRPSAAEVYHHPLFWDPDMRLSFFQDASDRLYLAVSKTGKTGNTETEENKTSSELLNKLESIAKDVFDSPWDNKLDSILLSDNESHKKHQKYEYDKVRELVRFIRNNFIHYNQLPEPVQEVLRDVPTGFEGYFRSRFPKLLMEVYKVLKEYCKEEERLKKYFKKSLDMIEHK